MTDRPNVTVVGVDPGKATGVAVVDVYRDHNENGAYFPRCHVVVRSLDEVPYDEYTPYIQNVYRHANGHKLVTAMEIYIVTRLTMQTQDTQSLEVIGMDRGIKHLRRAQLQRPIPEYLQKPSEVKRAFGRTILSRVLDTDLRGVSPHAIDGLSHATYWIHQYATKGIKLL